MNVFDITQVTSQRQRQPRTGILRKPDRHVRRTTDTYSDVPASFQPAEFLPGF